MTIELEPQKYYKIGCDYNHFCDEGTEKSFEIILPDVKHTIDKLYEKGVVKRVDSKHGK